jgi:exopolysaccharide biosynthesis protein
MRENLEHLLLVFSVDSVDDVGGVISATASDSSEIFLAINDGGWTMSSGAGSEATSGCVAVFSCNIVMVVVSSDLSARTRSEAMGIGGSFASGAGGSTALPLGSGDGIEGMVSPMASNSPEVHVAINGGGSRMSSGISSSNSLDVDLAIG